MEVLLLGTGSADGWPNPFCDCLSCGAAQAAGVLRGQSAALVDDVLLLDCGPEAPRAALRAGRTLTGVRDILLTHSHPDHTGPAALLWRAWARAETPLTVHGPAAALDVCHEWVGPEDPVTFHPVRPGDSFATRHHQVVALKANHGDAGSGPGLLWDLTDDHGCRLLYATDTGRPGAATMARLRAAQPYDLVILEETFGRRSDLGQDHLDLGSFAALLADLRTAGTIGPATRVVATHLGHHNPPPAELDHELAEVGARSGRDGQVLAVGHGDVRPSPGGRRTLVLGGARSGKSLLAERLVHDRADVTYVATGGSRPDDPEWQERVRVHRRRRPEGWSTRETTDLVGVLAEAAPGSAVLVDCLTLWLTDRLDASGAWDEVDAEGWRKELDSEVEHLLQALRSSRSEVIVVSNEVGQGVVPATRSGRVFQDELGALNARVAEVSDQVVVVVAGLPTTLKGHPV